MALLLSSRGLARTVGTRPLFEDVSFDVADGDRTGVIGPNGSGKSTLLRILGGMDKPDAGEVAPVRGLRLTFVTQTDTFDLTAPTLTVLTEAIAATGCDHHEAELAAELELRKAGFLDPGQVVGALSGGWRKRLQVLCALAPDPQLVLLDEPTNHLDLEGVLWLEDLLRSAPFACVVVSHDRAFIESVCTAVVEINPVYPGGAFRAVGGYSDFIQAREQFLTAQKKQEERLANTVTKEIAWLRRNPKAQTVKAASRVNAALDRQDTLAELSWRNRQGGAADIDFTGTGRRTADLLVGKQLQVAIAGRLLATIEELVVSPGDRIGLLGLNGSGKSTLLRILSGELPLPGGTLKRATELRCVYFRQDRSTLDKNATLRRALCANGEVVAYREQRIHVNAWAKRFRFRPEQMEEPVGMLSGGEQARLLIASLVTKQGDVLILDEPTNDLDIPTLEVLEEAIGSFPGAVLLVTHDRALLDRVSTRLLALDGAGGASWYADYWQWQQAQEVRLKAEAKAAGRAGTGRATNSSGGRVAGGGASGLSKSERRELERMQEKIEMAEKVVADLDAEMADPQNATDAMKLTAFHRKREQAQDQVDALYIRWGELEAKAAGG